MMQAHLLQLRHFPGICHHRTPGSKSAMHSICGIRLSATAAQEDKRL
jgi:hypothetical protein